jgi:hypothetical protein
MRSFGYKGVYAFGPRADVPPSPVNLPVHETAFSACPFLVPFHLAAKGMAFASPEQIDFVYADELGVKSFEGAAGITCFRWPCGRTEARVFHKDEIEELFPAPFKKNPYSIYFFESFSERELCGIYAQDIENGNSRKSF